MAGSRSAARASALASLARASGRSRPSFACTARRYGTCSRQRGTSEPSILVDDGPAGTWCARLHGVASWRCVNASRLETRYQVPNCSLERALPVAEVHSGRMVRHPGDGQCPHRSLPPKNYGFCRATSQRRRTAAAQEKGAGTRKIPTALIPVGMMCGTRRRSTSWPHERAGKRMHHRPPLRRSRVATPRWPARRSALTRCTLKKHFSASPQVVM